MKPLSAQDIVRAWELGQNKPEWFKALLVLAPSFPDVRHVDLAKLSLGKRNLLLIRLYQNLFGQKLDARVTCPKCSEVLEFSLEVDTFLQSISDSESLAALHPLSMPAPETRQMALGGYRVDYRFPDSHDLAMVTGIDDDAFVVRQLLSNCILSIIPPQDEAPDNVLAQDPLLFFEQFLEEGFGEECLSLIKESDELSEICLSLDCHSCQYPWVSKLEITSFLWSELTVYAKRLMKEVALLAKTFSWREADILKMPSERRFSYLELVGV